MAKKDLSQRQKNILKFIIEALDKHGRPPTIREIGESVDIPSTSVVNYNLTRLVERGMLKREKDVSRGIRVTDKALEYFGITPDAISDMIRVKLLGNIVAGSPIDVSNSDFAVYDEDDMVEIGKGMVRGTQEDLFALRVSGESMIDAMVNDGDIVILREHKHGIPRNGEMVAAWIISDETTTLKYYYLENGRVRLQPANPTMDPIFVAPENLQVQGKVELVLRRPGGWV